MLNEPMKMPVFPLIQPKIRIESTARALTDLNYKVGGVLVDSYNLAYKLYWVFRQDQRHTKSLIDLNLRYILSGNDTRNPV